MRYIYIRIYICVLPACVVMCFVLYRTRGGDLGHALAFVIAVCFVVGLFAGL